MAFFIVLCALGGIIVMFSNDVLSAGISVGDQGAVAAGRGGAFVAKADDATAIEYNPAGLTSLHGTQLYLSNRFGYAHEQFRRAPLLDWSEAGEGIPDYVTFDTVNNEHTWQLLGPMIVVSTDFGLQSWAFALGTYAPAGISTQEFSQDGGQRYMLTRRDTKILYYSLSAAWRYKDVFGVGVSLQWVDLAQLELQLIVNGDTTPGQVSPVSSLFDMAATVKGADHTGISAILGFWVHPMPSFQLAFSGRLIPTYLHADSELSLTPVFLSLEEAPELSRNDNPDNNVTFAMTLPMELRAGARYIHLRGKRDLYDLELDVRYEFWSQMDEYIIDGKGLYADVMGVSVEVGEIVIPKHWKNTFSVRFGGDMNVIDNRLIIRAGTFYETAASRKNFAYVDFPATHRLGASAGTTLILGRFDVSLSYTYVYEIPFSMSESNGQIYQQVPGSFCEAPYTDNNNCDAHYPEQPSATANSGVYVSSYHFSSLALSYRF